MPQYDKAWEKKGQDRILAPFPDLSDFLNGPGNETRHEIRGDVKQVIRRTTLAIHVHATRTATHLPEARGWPRPQCSHDSLCHPGQTSERRSQCHHLLWMQSNHNSKLATWDTAVALHLQMDAHSKFNHSVVYTKHGVYY